MFNIGLGELLFIAVLALMVLGPERLPKLMRQLGEIVYQIRTVVNQFNNQFAEELKPIREIQSLAADLNPMRQIGGALDQATQPQPSIAPPTPAVQPAITPQTAAASTPSGPAPIAPLPFPGAGDSHPMAQISRQMAAVVSPPDAATANPPTAEADL